MVRLRAFRATDDPKSCQKFIDGHSKVLNSIGIHKVTSLNDTWKDNPYAYVFIVESEDGEQVYGGGRIHVYHPDYELPFQEAIRFMDPKVDDFITRFHNDGGVSELCGLWNSREVAGMGFGSVYLSRAGVTMLKQLNVKNMVVLCASYTVPLAQRFGCEIDTTLGENGTFFYPKLDLVATVLLLQDAPTINKAEQIEKDRVFDLRNNLNQTTVETLKTRSITIDYQLNVDK